MTSIRKALIFGVLVWLVPFAVAFLIFPLRESSRPLFESIMPVVIAAATVAFAVTYLRRARRGALREGALLGLAWFVISVAIDAPMMLFGGPMKMTLAEYVADIGITYLIIPVITVGIGFAAARGSSPPEAE